ncbi:MAG: TIGR02757 family protein [FCB group bacterium]|nr:TIGR02757 family protein [FCB group bacterium]
MPQSARHNAERLYPRLEALRERYNRRAYVCPDPLQFLYEYDDPADREVVGILASSLAFGNVTQILKSVTAVLEHLASPADDVRALRRETLRRRLRGFKHRYVTGEELADTLYGAGQVMKRYGSLGNCFTARIEQGDATVLPAMVKFVSELRRESGTRSYLVPSPEDGSACKRLNLYLRWMVRRDDVDPGGWDVPASMLVVPLDTHLHRLARALGLTRRRSADLKAALEVTEAFRTMTPEDPVRYDFALTRLGIRSDTDIQGFVVGCGCQWPPPTREAI